MNRAAMALAGLCVALGATFTVMPTAHAGPLCAHRSAAHSAQHGGQEVDSAWHVSHGDPPTCDGDNSSDSGRQSDEVDDDGPVLHRDHAGFHCTWHGCG